MDRSHEITLGRFTIVNPTTRFTKVKFKNSGNPGICAGDGITRLRYRSNITTRKIAGWKI